MATTQQMREGEAELARIARWVDRTVMRSSREAQAAAPLHPEVASLCAAANTAAEHIRRGLAVAQRRGQPVTRLRRRAADWLNLHSSRMLRSLGNFSPRDLDVLAGCMTRVEAVAQTVPPNLARLRSAIAQRLNMPGMREALYEEEGEGELRERLRRFVANRLWPSQPPPPIQPPRPQERGGPFRTHPRDSTPPPPPSPRPSPRPSVPPPSSDPGGWTADVPPSSRR